MKIFLSLFDEQPTRGAGALGTAASHPPVFPLGTLLVVQARFTVDESAAVVLDDPRTSQKTLLRLRSPGRRERALAELNPSLVDRTGEITAPPSQRILLAPGDSVETLVPLLRYYPDHFAAAGWFDLTVEYADASSPPLPFGYELSPASVPLLIAVVLDDAADASLRLRALAILRSLPMAPELRLAAPGEDPSEGCVRELDNLDRAQAFLASWPQLAGTPAIQRFFAAQCLPRPK